MAALGRHLQPRTKTAQPGNQIMLHFLNRLKRFFCHAAPTVSALPSPIDYSEESVQHTEIPTTRLFFIFYDDPEEEATPTPVLTFNEICENALANAVASLEIEEELTLPSATPPTNQSQSPLPPDEANIEMDLQGAAEDQEHGCPIIQATMLPNVTVEDQSQKLDEGMDNPGLTDSFERGDSESNGNPAPTRRVQVQRNLAWADDGGFDQADSN
jgi:hypothetical protein